VVADTFSSCEMTVAVERWRGQCLRSWFTLVPSASMSRQTFTWWLWRQQVCSSSCSSCCNLLWICGTTCCVVNSQQ